VLFAYKPLLDYAERADDVRVQQAASTLDSAQLATSHPEAEALITLIGRPGWTASLLELLENADIVSVHVPLTADTVGLIGPRELSVMKPSAVLVNTSRGGIVDEEALAAALEEHRLFGAGLDVFVGEPAVNPRLLGCPRITLLPHIGSATLATRRRMETRAFEAAPAAVRGVVPNGAVNAESWQRR
jgi:glyoxylate reductase